MVDVEAASDTDIDAIDIRLTLDEKGDAKGTFTALIHGGAAQRLADRFEVVVGSPRDNLLRNVVLGWLPWADVKEVTLSSAAGSWRVALRAEVTIGGFANPEGRSGKRWVLPGIEPVHFVYPRAKAATLAYAVSGPFSISKDQVHEWTKVTGSTGLSERVRIDEGAKHLN